MSTARALEPDNLTPGRNVAHTSSASRGRIMYPVVWRWVAFTTVTGALAGLLTVMVTRPWRDDFETENEAALWFGVGGVGGAFMGLSLGVITGFALVACMMLAPTDDRRLLRTVRGFAALVFGIVGAMLCYWWLIIMSGDLLFVGITIAAWAVVVYATRLVATGAGRASRSRAGN